MPSESVIEALGFVAKNYYANSSFYRYSPSICAEIRSYACHHGVTKSPLLFEKAASQCEQINSGLDEKDLP